MREAVSTGKTLLAAILGISALVGTAASASQSPVAARTQANVMVEVAFTASQDYRDAFHEVTLDAALRGPAGPHAQSPRLLGRRTHVEGPLRIAGGRRAPLAKRLLRAGGSRLAWTDGNRDRGDLPRGEPALSPRPLARRRRPAAFRASGRHAVFLAGRHLVDGAQPAAPLAGGVSATGRRPEGQRLQRGPDRRRAVPRHAGLRPARGQRGGLPLGKGLRWHPARVLRQGRPAAPVPRRSGLCAVPCRGLGIPSALDGRRADRSNTGAT